MLQDIWVLLIEAEEAIKKLVSLKVSIVAELARQVAETPDKTMGAKKRKVLSLLDQEVRKAVIDQNQFYQENIFGDLKNQSQIRRHWKQTEKRRNLKRMP